MRSLAFHNALLGFLRFYIHRQALPPVFPSSSVSSKDLALKVLPCEVSLLCVLS